MTYFLHLTSTTESDLITNTFIILISQMLFTPNSLRLPWELTQGLNYAPKLHDEDESSEDENESQKPQSLKKMLRKFPASNALPAILET